MALPSSGQIKFSNIRTELGIPSQSPFSLKLASLGSYVSINQASPNKPNAVSPYAISEWYSYNHLASSSNTYTISFPTRYSGTLNGGKNGSTYLSRSTVGTSSGTISAGNTYYGSLVTSSAASNSMEISSSIYGYIYADYDIVGTLTSPTFTNYSGENIDITGYNMRAIVCLVKGTLVTLADETQIPIEELTVDTYVKSAIIDGLTDTNNVLDLKQWRESDISITNSSSRIVEIAKNVAPTKVDFNDGLLTGSSFHVQLVKRDKEWRFLRFGEIKAGDIFITEDNQEVVIYKVNMTKEDTEVYQITLNSPTHTFYANNILTHNIK